MSEENTLIQPEENIECPFCIALISKKAKKCRHCGETVCVSLRASEEAQKNNNNSQPMVFMNAGGGSSSSSSASSSSVGGGYPLVSSKSKGTALLLCLCLGGIGIHKFYLGKNLAGWIYLLTCWTLIPAILACFDAFALFTMSRDQFAVKYR